MGGSASSQSDDDGEIKNSSNKQNNFGLVNLASENLDSTSWNFIEIFTFVVVGIGALYFLRLWCEKNDKAMRDALQGVQVDHHPMVQPHVARLPVIQNPPPPPPQPLFYPGADGVNSFGGKSWHNTLSQHSQPKKEKTYALLFGHNWD